MSNGQWTMDERVGDRQRDDAEIGGRAPTIPLFGRRVPMPRSRILRIVLGIVLVILGLFGFLPILGFWMIPVGLLVLSYEFATIRRMRRRSTVWWARRRNRR